MEKAKVYFTKNISSESLIEIYKKLDIVLNGNVGVKLHSGEKGNTNYLNGTVIESNTAYDGARNTTKKHEKLMDSHGWSKYFKVDILDSEGKDKVLDIKNGKVLNHNYVGKNIDKYDSMLILSHFKGHPMGGYGGALKQLSIGLASSYGKRYIHCIGKENGTYEEMFKVEQDKFLEAMADAAKSIIDDFKGKIIYINVMCNLSVDCDCCENAKKPCMNDVGILGSTDPVAIDKACIDLVYNSEDENKKELIKRIESKNGIHTIEAAYEHGIGNIEYDLIKID